MLVALLLLTCTCAMGFNAGRNLLQIIPPADTVVPPWEVTTNSSGTVISVSLVISQIRSVLYDAEVSFELYQSWFDSRFLNDTLHPEEFILFKEANFEGVWQPDTYIANELPNGVFETTPTDFVKAYPNGSVFQATRNSIIFHCNVKWFSVPMKDEICSIKFKSASFTTDVLKLVWRSDSPVQYSPDFIHHAVESRKTETTSCTKQAGSTPCLELKLHLWRVHQVMSIQLYLPSTCIIFITWLGFWIHHAEVSGRTRISTVCLVAITTESIAVMIINPEQNHMEAIEGWNGGCIIFCTLAFLEFIIVHNIHLKREKEENPPRRDSQSDRDMLAESSESGQRTEAGPSHTKTTSKRNSFGFKSKVKVAPAIETRVIPMESNSIEDAQEEPPKCKIRPETIDRIAIVIFPVFFILFNIFYWTYFLTERDKY